jgi:hypothetical protein
MSIRIVKIYVTNWQHFQTDDNTPWIGLIYGGQLGSYDNRKSVLTSVDIKSYVQYASNNRRTRQVRVRDLNDALDRPGPFTR